MNKSKLVFAVITVIVIIGCLICFLAFGGFKKPQAEANPEQATTGTENAIHIPENVPQPPLNLDPTDPSINISETVTINQVKKDPNEVIERNPITDASHPEVLEIETTSPMMSAEGSVYRNDKEISIDIMDAKYGDKLTFTFGYITGSCNRFLYLNPQFKRNDEPLNADIFFKFSQPYGGGTVTTCGIPAEENAENELFLNYTFFRSLEERTVSGYVDPKHPGAIWFTQTPLDNNIYIDVQAHYGQGGLFATMRLTIAKAEDGTYSIVDIDNRNLLTNGENDLYSKSELAYLVKVADTTFRTPGATNFYSTLFVDKHFQVEDCIIEQRDAATGLYYNEFLPYQGSEWTKDYAESQIPIMAVSYNWAGLPTQTMYFYVINEPTATTHGTYQYIGHDFPLYATLELLRGYGYDGNG